VGGFAARVSEGAARVLAPPARVGHYAARVQAIPERVHRHAARVHSPPLPYKNTTFI